MTMLGSAHSAFWAVLFLMFYSGANPVLAGDTGSIHGKVFVKDIRAPLKGASVRIIQLDRSTVTDEKGRYEFRNVPAGRYSITAHMHVLLGDVVRVDVEPGQAAVADFELAFVRFRHEVVVTASARSYSL